MILVKDVYRAINDRSPFSAAQSWDNVGLLVGDEDWEVRRIYVALDATDEVVEKATSWGADLLVTHHPMVFSPMKRIVAGDFIGRRVISLIEHRIAYIAMHTNYDTFGMADLAADRLGLVDTLPLELVEAPEYPRVWFGVQKGLDEGNPPVGIGKTGMLPKRTTLQAFAEMVKNTFGLSHVRFFGREDAPVERVAICPGSGKSVISLAQEARADVLVTGDIDHHSGIDAVANGLSIIDAGHYGIEHIFIEDEAAYLREVFSEEVEIRTEPFAEPIQIV